MKCFHCAAELPNDTRYCGRCGIQVGDPQSATMVVEVEESEALLARVRRVFDGDYEVEGEIARGGMAIVYRAKESLLGRHIALKVLRPDLGLSAAAAARFKREAQTVASLDHSNIIPVYHVGQLGGLLYIAMKLVEGRSLDLILETQGAFPVSVVLWVLREAARGLAFANERGITHRDVKAANILIDTEGRVIVSDFGVALRASDVTLTAAGTLIGTPAYMSPEQCSGKRAGPQSDQYSLAVAAFQMLAGATPFQSDTLAGIMQHHFFTPPPDLRLVREDIPPALLALIARALHKNPVERFGTTGEMLQALEAIPFSADDAAASHRFLCDMARGGAAPRITTGVLPAPPDMPTLAVPTGPRRRRPSLGLLAAGVVLVLAVGLWIVTPRLGGREAPQSVGTVPESSAAAPVRTPPPAAQVLSRPLPVATGKLRLLTSPPSAEILIDGRSVGLGSIVDLRVPLGPRRLRVQAAGYQAWDTTIVVRAGVTHTLGRVVLRAPGE